MEEHARSFVNQVQIGCSEKSVEEGIWLDFQSVGVGGDTAKMSVHLDFVFLFRTNFPQYVRMFPSAL